MYSPLQHPSSSEQVASPAAPAPSVEPRASHAAYHRGQEPLYIRWPRSTDPIAIRTRSVILSISPWHAPAVHLPPAYRTSGILAVQRPTKGRVAHARVENDWTRTPPHTAPRCCCPCCLVCCGCGTRSGRSLHCCSTTRRAAPGAAMTWPYSTAGAPAGTVHCTYLPGDPCPALPTRFQDHRAAFDWEAFPGPFFIQPPNSRPNSAVFCEACRYCPSPRCPSSWLSRR